MPNPAQMPSRGRPTVAYTSTSDTLRTNTEADDLAAELAAAIAENTVLRTQIAQLRQNRPNKKAKTDSPGRPADVPIVFADPARQFRHEVWLHWLASTPEADRNRWTLRDYDLSSQWTADLTRLSPDDRRKAVAVAVDILTRRAHETPSREVRPHHSGSAGTSGSLFRSHDSARAWRCNVQRNTPQAKRAMWWELPGGRVELARIGNHDDSDGW